MDSLQLEHIRHHGHKLSEPEPTSRRSRLHISRKTLYTSLFILVPVTAFASALELAFAAQAARRGPSTWNGSSAFFTEPGNASQTLSLYPAHVFADQGNLKLVSASLSLVSALVLGGVAWYSSVNGPITTIFAVRVALMFTMGANSILAFATSLHVFIAHGMSAHFNEAFALFIAELPTYHQYDRGVFDLETWACETRDLPNFDDGKLHALCILEAGARWMTPWVFLLVSSLFVLVLLDRRGERHLVVTWKSRSEDDYY